MLLTALVGVDLIDSRIVAIDADCTVEDACDASLTSHSPLPLLIPSLQLLLREDISCLAVKALPGTQTSFPFLGLFDVRVHVIQLLPFSDSSLVL